MCEESVARVNSRQHKRKFHIADEQKLSRTRWDRSLGCEGCEQAMSCVAKGCLFVVILNNCRWDRYNVEDVCNKTVKKKGKKGKTRKVQVSREELPL